jgi:predicted nucleotidyltransferase
VRAYLFGSALLQDAAWADIDILVVCEADEDTNRVRAALADHCAEFPIDLLIMTADEEAEFHFVRTENCRWLADNMLHSA